jgi:mono/diheme cytochrome c family protein
MIFSRKFITGAVNLLPLFFILILTGCQKEEAASALTPLESRGKGVYLTNCIACHNPDPRIDGSIGPAVAFSSLALLEARVLTRSYPAGYTPKRKSEMMPDFPQLKDDIPGLHAYLNSFKK